MRTWTEKIEINAPIDQVWKLLDGSLEDMQKIMPSLKAVEPIKVTEDVVGSIHKQQFNEGKYTKLFEVKTLAYENTEDYKKITVSFIHGMLYEITSTYEVRKLADDQTEFTYTTMTKPLKWILKIFLSFSGGKVASQFAERVKEIAEEESAGDE